MTSMLLATIVQTALLATGAEAASVETVSIPIETYAAAHQTVTETGKPMVVMVSTDWCPPCQTMKKTILPRVREHGFLRKVAFAVVNPDRDRDLAEKLTGGGPIPQLVMFRKTPDGWMRKNLVGGQSVETVEQFIKEGLAKDETDKKPSAEAGDKSDKSDKNAPLSDKNAPPSDKTTVRHGAADDEASARHG
jgi:thioredoxin-like negative regulator of GroEL